MRILPLQKLFSLLVMMCATAIVFAQPANDDCSTPTFMILGADAASCVPVQGDTRGTVDATTVMDAPTVCSGSWFTDDVWFSFETGATPPANGVTVEVRLDPGSGTELIEQGMAIYVDCDATTNPLDCFSDVPGRRTIDFPPTCLEPNSTYLVRVWSAPDPRTNEGTFSICAYETPEDTTGGGGPNEPTARVIYEETFDEGFGDWTPVSETQQLNLITGDTVDTDWIWSETGCVNDFGGGVNCHVVPGFECQLVGVVGIPGGFYQTKFTGIPNNAGPDPTNTNPPYDPIFSYIVSPPIDLSKEDCVNLTWIESARYLNGGTLTNLGGFVQYSLDDGETWINPTTSIGTADITENYGGEYVVNGAPTNALQRSIPLIGAEGNTNVRIRFGFDGDFYFWIVDDIRLVEGSAADGVAQSNFFARSHTNPMSIHMVDSYDFLIDIANLSCQNLTNASVNVTVTNDAGEELHNINLDYGTIQADSLAENQAFNQPFTPPAVAGDYTNTYTLIADVDNDPSNNVRTFTTTVVDEMVFRKEDGNPNGVIAPNQTAGVFWEDGEAFTWEMGNIFYAPSGTTVDGDQLEFTQVSFQLGNPTVIIGDLLRIWLYEITDNDFDNIISKDDASELTRLGISEYTVTGTENGIITVDLESFTGQPLTIEPNTHYMATVETTTEVVRDAAMSIADDDTYDYSAAIFTAQQLGQATQNLDDMRYAHSFGISKENFFRIGPGNTGDLTTGNFPQNFTPVIRLGFDLLSTSTVEINNDIKVALSPNPTASDLTLNLSIEEPTDMEVSIVDLAGKVISTRSLSGVTELKEEFNVSNLSNGVYFVHINTKDGVRTEKFVISK